MPLLERLGLLEIDGYRFKSSLGGGSALSSIYEKADEKVVFKFLIAPRNEIELERVKLEYSVLKTNIANKHRTDTGYLMVNILSDRQL